MWRRWSPLTRLFNWFTWFPCIVFRLIHSVSLEVRGKSLVLLYARCVNARPSNQKRWSVSGSSSHRQINDKSRVYSLGSQLRGRRSTRIIRTWLNASFPEIRSVISNITWNIGEITQIPRLAIQSEAYYRKFHVQPAMATFWKRISFSRHRDRWQQSASFASSSLVSSVLNSLLSLLRL